MSVSHVYLLIGDEEFLKEEWLRNTRQKFFKNSDTFNNATDFELFFANEIDLPGVLSTAKTRPFLSSKRLIIIKNIELFNSPSHKEQLLNYAKSPSPDTVLILEADIKERDFSGNRFLVDLGKLTEVISFKKLYAANLCSWVSKRAVVKKKKIEPQAVELLIQLKGNNLKAIDEEIEKLSLYAGEKPLITQDSVQQLVGKDITNTIYDMVEAISRNDKKRAMALSLDFQKKDLPSSISLFCWNLRLLMRVKECLNKGYANQKIGDSLGLKKFQLDRSLNQARRVNIKWLETALLELAEFDLKIKTSGIYDSFSGWQMVVAKLLKALSRM